VLWIPAFGPERIEQGRSTMSAEHEASQLSRKLRKRPKERARLVSMACLVAVTLAGGALSGCATMMLELKLPAPPTGMPEEVLRYDWAGRRGDEVVVAYTVRADRAEEPRWVVIDLHQFIQTPLGAAPVAVLRPVPTPRPDPASMDAVPMIPRAAGVAGSRATTLAAIAQAYPLAIQTQAGRDPEVRLVAPDPTSPGDVQVATWQIELSRAPAPLEPVGRGLTRALLVPAALAVDLVTLPLQLILFSLVGMH
jgi:hypothetical protein